MPRKVKFLLGDPTPLDKNSALIWLAQGEIVLTKDQLRSLEAFVLSSNKTYAFLRQDQFMTDLAHFMAPSPEPVLMTVTSAPPVPAAPLAPPPVAPSGPPRSLASTEPIGPSRKLLDKARTFRARNVRRNVGQHENPIPMKGTLSVMNTTGGSEDSLARYFELKAKNQNFPYRWRIAGTDYDDLINGKPVTSRAVVAAITNDRGKIYKNSDQKPLFKIPFVIVHVGEVYVGPNLRKAVDTRGVAYTVNHLHIAELRRTVVFAGQIRFSLNSVLEGWSADSGGYACTNAQARECGLPMDKYEQLYAD